MSAPVLQVQEAARIMRTACPRLAAKFELSDGCWEWTAGKSPDGYGRFRWLGRTKLAHRLVYEIIVGPIADGLTLDHLCGNPGCVNPRHLEPVTLRENIARGAGVGMLNAAKTACVHGHAFTPENTYWNQGKRSCRECGRRTTAAWHRKQRERRTAWA